MGWFLLGCLGVWGKDKKEEHRHQEQIKAIYHSNGKLTPNEELKLIEKEAEREKNKREAEEMRRKIEKDIQFLQQANIIEKIIFYLLKIIKISIIVIFYILYFLIIFIMIFWPIILIVFLCFI